MKNANRQYRSFRLVGTMTLGLLSFASAVRAEEPFATGGFKEACATARKTNRIVLIDFYTTWCGPCILLDQKTWSDKGVRSWLVKTAVCRKIDAEKETALAERYKINAYPTILLLKPDGKEIDRLVGYRDPASFLVEARQALSGQDSIARAKAKLKAAGKDRPMERMEYARALEEKGHYAEALTEYLWCLDEGNKHDFGFGGVRLSYLMSDLQRLGAEYPPALTALKKRRDASRTILEKGMERPDIAMEFAAYNNALEQPEQTLALYNTFKAKDSDLARILFIHVSEILLEKRRYADLVAGAGDIPARARKEMAQYKGMTSISGIDESSRAALKKLAVDKSCGYFEALVGTDRNAEADEVRDEILTFDKSVTTYVALVKRAIRAERPETARKLVALAKSALNPTDFKMVEQEAK